MELLGKGGFGVVQKAYNIRECCFMAIKTFQKDDPNSLEDIISEDNFLTAVEDVNKKCQISKKFCPFLKYYGVFKTKKDNQISLLLEMESGLCTLDDLV